MAETILISCPECSKKLRTPSRLQGKKIRCKACNHIFTATPDAITAKGKKASPNPDYEADHNPYIVLDNEGTYRCPHCAGEMESEDAIICLHCGYNTQLRERHQTKAIYQTTGMDYFVWLLPGIACALVVLALIGFIVFLFVWLGDIADENKEAWWNFGIRAMRVYGIVFALFSMFFAAKFAIKRLIFHPSPPEREKRERVTD
jgi:DNA-directed RNA polymerase subunit RPC12/RpoP